MNPQKQTMNTIENCTETKHTMMTRSQRQQEIKERIETNDIEVFSSVGGLHEYILENGNIVYGMKEINPNDYYEPSQIELLSGKLVLHKKITDADDITNKKFEHATILSFKVNGEEHKKKDNDCLDIMKARVILLTKLCLASKLDKETIHKYKISSVKMGKCGEKSYKYHGDKGCPDISVRGISATYSIAQIKKLAKLLDEPVEIIIEQKIPEFEDGYEKKIFRYNF
jgi:hypothetical protein